MVCNGGKIIIEKMYATSIDDKEGQSAVCLKKADRLVEGANLQAERKTENLQSLFQPSTDTVVKQVVLFLTI